MATSKEKIDAIFDLRAAAEKKALAEKALVEDPKAEKRDQLLDAQLALEEKTMIAIDVCHECGHQHASGAAHA
ncbi:MAG: hypothetical protein JO078_05565 [Candidatus Eremiobacteraeota bacterium]|nr:hypothetical protein [Candidatus Eremiobacteraeota bacterium]MBV9699576.1 hypothetical protein [Candidatus Eremiobacteraeota bacterium]